MDKSIYTEEYKVLLEMLRTARKSSNITQEELGQRIKQTQSFVSKYERGERRLDVVEVRAICYALGISFQDFVSELDKAIAMRHPYP
jgi:transcriptional regulator with XRE-family HTH domain